MKNILTILVALTLLSSCGVEPEKIDYGKEACVYCKMNIVDQQHAAEIVSQKGKVFKYDAIECMLRDNDHNKKEDVALFLVMNYTNPDSFLDATSAHFIVSENIPSPMGAFLSAVISEEEAKEIVNEKSGEVYNWEQINNHF